MLSLTHTGLNYRTKLMDRSRAESFARCLRGNDHFTGIGVCESDRAKSPAVRFFVAFEPSSAARRYALLDTAANQQAARAAREGDDFIFCLDKDGGRPFHWCFNPISQETHEVCLQDCSCPHRVHRLRALGLPCKHMITLREGRGHYTSF